MHFLITVYLIIILKLFIYFCHNIRQPEVAVNNSCLFFLSIYNFFININYFKKLYTFLLNQKDRPYTYRRLVSVNLQITQKFCLCRFFLFIFIYEFNSTVKSR